MKKKRSRAFFFAVVCGLFITGDFVLANETEADQVTFEEIVSPFLSKYCTSCHGEEKDKGDVRLHKINFNLASSKDLEKWQDVLKQLQLNEMPPKKKDQPSSELMTQVVEWIQAELSKSGNMKAFNEKMQNPHYGNFVDHERLFSGEITEESYSPARLWRRSPHHFEKSKLSFFGFLDPRHHKSRVDMSKLKQPFHESGAEGISDFAALLYADSATFDVLYRNAESVVDGTLLLAFIEMEYISQGKTMQDWKADRAKVLKGQADQIAQMEKEGKNPRYIKGMHRELNSKYQFPTPEIYREIILDKKAPTLESMEAAVRFHFKLILEREPTDSELEKYASFMLSGIRQSGPYFGLRNALIAIMVSPNFIYRSELGLGTPVGDGRHMLSPPELAYAIAYALTDQKPDELLLKAVAEGKLVSREDVKREVIRILQDSEIEKPRIMRFFHEYFEYDRANDVFKDDKRFYKGYTHYKISRNYVKDTDVLIQHILKEDKNVLHQLLTTEEYFVAHSGDNAKEIQQVEAHQKLYARFKDKNWKGYSRKAKEKDKTEISKEDLKYVQSLSPDFKGINADKIHNIMKYVSSFEKTGVTPLTYKIYRGTDATINGVAAYNLPTRKWDFPAKQPFVLAKGKRAGILSHPSWLIAHSLNATTDPVRRGKWVRERLLAGTVPDLPVTVDASVPEDSHKTLRELYSVTEDEKCWKCHVKMNPLGYPFEVFDDFGRWRTEEKLEGLPVVKGKHQTKPVNSKGYLKGSGDKKLDGEVENAFDLVNRLAASRRVQQSFIRHAFRYWMGRNELLSDSKTLIRAEKDYMHNDGSFNALIVSLLTSDSFIYRKRELQKD